MTPWEKQAPFVIAVDESSAGPYVTSAGAIVPKAKLAAVVDAVQAVKRRWGIDEKAEIHCRKLFVNAARRKGPFSGLTPSDVHPFITETVVAARAAGCKWCAVECDMRKYPPTLRINPGEPFDVSAKHVQGLCGSTVLHHVEQQLGDHLELIFDRDFTPVRWGMEKRMQATHFLRVSKHCVPVTPDNEPLLELADVAAYTYAQACAARHSGDRKVVRFLRISRLMQAVTLTFSFPEPTSQPSQPT